MRKSLPLLQAPKPAAIEQVSCSAPNPDCRKCALHRQPFFNRCVPAAAEGDLESGERLLTIGIAPGREEDRQNRPNVGESGSFLRFQLRAQWKGAIAHTNAVNCFIPSTRVQAAGIEKAYRRWYSGPVLRITAGEHSFTGTPNHPVLTRRGWIALRDLVEGDDLVCGALSESGILVDPHVDDRPPEFQQLFDALSKLGAGERRAGANVDFHGDGSASDVDVVTFDGSLRLGRQPTRNQHGNQVGFEGTDLTFAALPDEGSRSFTSLDFIVTSLATLGGKIGAASHAFSGSESHLSVAKALGVGVVASGDPVLTENPFQSAWITAKDLGEFVQRSSIDGIQTAQINSIEQLAWSGHVYNLQTESNWYIAEGVIAHNCYPGTDEKTGALAEIKTDYIDACRPYVRNVIREFQPTRILAFGTQAIHSLFNRAPGIMAVRRGFSWLLNHHDNRHDCPTWYVNVEGGEQVPWGCRCEPIPVLFLMHPAAACRNRFIKKEWMEDLKWALTTPDDFFRERYIFLRQGRVEEIETVSHTMLALSELEGTCQQFGKPIVIDVETRGKQFNKDFRIISLAMCIAGENHAYVWTAQALRDPDIVRHLVSTFDDENNIWVEQSDYDEVSLVAAWGHKLAGERRDTRLIRRLMEPGIKSDLGTMSERVGMGGYKSDFDDLVDLAIKRCIPKKATRSVKSKSSGGWEPLQVELFDDCPDPEARLAIYEGYKSGDKFFEPRTYAYAIVPTRKTSIYNGQDVISTGLYHEMAWPELRRRKNLAMVWDELSCPSGRSYAQMRIWGIPADKQAITTLIHWAQTQQATAERACRRHLLDTKWADMNIGSDKQVAKLLFSPYEDGGLGLFPIKRTKKGNAPSTDKESMAALADKHPFVADYSRYAYWDGFVNKGKEFLRSIRADGRMHPSYLPDGTESGRACIARGTMIEVVRDVSVHPRGVPIEDVREGDQVYCYDDDRKLTLRRVLWAGKTGHRRTVRLRWRGTGRRTEGFLDLTPEHRVRLVDGTYRRADQLRSGDRTLALSRGVSKGYARLWVTGVEGDVREHCFIHRCPNNHEILSVEDIGAESDVFDLEVDGTHNFIANEICVHNSATEPNVFNIRRADDCPTCKSKEPAMLSCETCGGSGIDPDTKKQRDMIRAEDGYVLVEIDESQIELRGMAALSGDEVMTTAFVEDRDLHAYAAEIAGVTRQEAKPVNFGLAYGLMADTLSKRVKCTKERAQKIMDAVIGAYPGMMAHKKSVLDFARAHGFTYTVWFLEQEDGKWKTVMAGQRPLPDIASEDGARRNHAENAAFATLIQGSFSGFLVLDSHARLCRYIEEEGLQRDVQVILSVYDSLVLHVREELVEMMVKVARRIMGRVVIGYTKEGKPFPRKQDVKVGKSYGSMKKLEHWQKERAARRS